MSNRDKIVWALKVAWPGWVIILLVILFGIFSPDIYTYYEDYIILAMVPVAVWMIWRLTRKREEKEPTKSS